jgi:UDP-N-acetylmuramyl pentapeptide phosphotransferase/UDP-N-acetylglucosamine-1-phosphate transferase
MSRVLATLALAAATALATEILARLAPRIGWTDAPRAAAARKRQGRPVPAVGGAAIALVLLAAGELAPARSEVLWGSWLPGAGWFLASLAALFAVGVWDDLRDLAAGPKAALQLVGIAPLALGTALGQGLAEACALAVLALAALNLLNTFDNADGALAGHCAVGLLAGAPAISAACLGFLPLNLDAARPRNRASSAPSAYLGDSGAFLLGLLVVARPESAGLLVLPALDLARLALLRWRTGSRPWVGDRAHLAHRLEARGVGRIAAAAILAAIGAPAALLAGPALASGALLRAALAVLATAAGFALALQRTRVPCPARARSE